MLTPFVSPTFVHICGTLTECNGDIKKADFFINTNKIISFSIHGEENARVAHVSCEGYSRQLISDTMDFFDGWDDWL